MPTYDYLCTSCGHRFELFQGIKEEPHESCPTCGGPVKRLFSAGSGFIITDFSAPAYLQGKFVNVKLSEYLGKWTLLCFYPGEEK